MSRPRQLNRFRSKTCQKPTSGRGTAAQPDGKGDQQQACQRKPDNRISHVIVKQMHLKRPGFRDAARKHWSLQIDVERPNPIPPERLRHREMIRGEPQPLRVLYVGPEQAGCHGKTQVAGQRDGLVGDELRYRELDDALGLTALAGDVLADAPTGKNGRHAVAIGVRPSRWLRECERCRTSSSRSCNALDRRRQGVPGPRGFAKPDGPLVFIKWDIADQAPLMSDIPSTAARSRSGCPSWI